MAITRQKAKEQSFRGIPTNYLLLFTILFLSVAWVGDRLSRTGCQTQSVPNSETFKSSTVPKSYTGSTETPVVLGSSNRQSQPSPPTEAELETFIDHFVAANPTHTEHCKAYLRSPANFNVERESFINWKWLFSQYNQDWFLFVNFFYQMTQHNQTGFYIESGANSAWRVSNTAFLDYCLGWKGLCIEPTTRYHDQLRTERSCELITNCLSDVEGEIISLSNEVPGTAGNDAVNVTCRRLDNLLRERNIFKVDLWSLDVEGFEVKVLSGMDWNNDAQNPIHIQSILMEQQELGVGEGPCEQINIDYRLTTLGYGKYRIVSDAFYYKASNGLRFADSNVHASGGSRTQALDSYYHGLEDSRCKEKGGEVKFFTDPL